MHVPNPHCVRPSRRVFQVPLWVDVRHQELLTRLDVFDREDGYPRKGFLFVQMADGDVGCAIVVEV